MRTLKAAKLSLKARCRKGPLTMVPAQSKLTGEKRVNSPDEFFDSPMTKVSKGTAVFSDDYVNSMAEGKMKGLPKNLDDIIVDVDKENDDPVPRCSKKMKSYSGLDAQEMMLCPKYVKRNVFAVFEDASYYSDGELKHFNIKCQSTESSPCSYCETPSPSPPKQPPEVKNEFAQAKGFDINDYVGEEETPKKISANACKWCHWDPCIMKNENVNQEGEVIVDNLMAQEEQGVQLEKKNYRCALYRMYARKLGYRGERVMLPVCVQVWIDKNFTDEGEQQTGFIPSGEAN